MTVLRCLYCLLLLLLFSNRLLGQSHFELTILGWYNPVICQVKNAPGHYVVVQQYSPISTTNLTIAHISPDGILTPQKTINLYSPNPLWLMGITQMGDGYAVLWNTASSSWHNEYIQKLNQNFEPIWTKNIGMPHSPLSNPVDIKTTEDGGLLIMARVSDPDLGERQYINRLDSNGNTRWAVYASPSYSDPQFVQSVEMPDRKTVIMGSRNGEAILTMVDSVGTILWSKKHWVWDITFKGIGSAHRTSGNGFAFLADIEGGPMSNVGILGAIVVYCDENGSVLRAVIVDRSDDGGYASKVRMTPTAQGFTVYNRWSADLSRVMHLDALGNVQWRIEHRGLNSSVYHSRAGLATTGSDGLVFTDNVNLINSPQSRIIKIGPQGESCGFSPISIFQESVQLNTANYTGPNGYKSSGNIFDGPSLYVWQAAQPLPDTTICLLTAQEDPTERQSLSLFPNPMHEEGFIHLTESWSGEPTILLHDAMGRSLAVYSEQLGGIVRFSTEKIPSGMYTCSLLRDGIWVASSKVVVQH